MNDTLREIENAIDDVVIGAEKAIKTVERIANSLDTLLDELREVLADAENAQNLIGEVDE